MRTSPRLSILAFALLIVTLIGGAVLLLSTRPEPVHIVIEPPMPTPTATTPGEIQVYVTGAVNQPNQVIRLPYNSRVSDALALAGGTSANADLTRVNLVAVLHDGDQVHVYEVGAVEAAADTSVIPTPQGGARVNVNTANLDELMTLPGVGEVLAQRIIDRREQVGRFAGMTDLDAIEGIGEALMERLEPLVSFD